MLSFLNSNKKLITLTFFLLFLLGGTIIYSDYGISIDEDNTRLNGFITLKYLFEIIAPEQVANLNEIIKLPNFEISTNQSVEQSGGTQGLGVVFDLPMALIEFIFQINDTREHYLIRHFSTFLVFFLSVYYFFLIGKKRYNSYFIALLGSFFLIISPRIFAESFYNNKDLIFMSLFIINLYFGINFLTNPTIKNAILFSFISAFSINIRILGVILPSLIFFFYILYILRNDGSKKYPIKNLIISIFFLFLFTILFWPYLWENPIVNFIKTFQSLSDYDFEIYNFYLGKFVNAKYLPWHYPLIWILVSIPFYYLLLFFIGALLLMRRIIKRLFKIEDNNSLNDLWRGDKEMMDLLFLFTLIIPLILVITFNSTLYDGWRHLYFIYPSFLMICLFTINTIKLTIFKRKSSLFVGIFLIFTIPTILWMYKNHPYQNLYFNFFAGKSFNEKFDMDYWGLSNHDALMKISKNESYPVSVAKLGTSDLHLSRSFLNKKYRDKILISDSLDNADYIINNYRDWYGKINNYESKIPSNFERFYDIKVDGISINTIYKKK